MVRCFLLLFAILPLGCASSVLEKFDHQHSYHCRIDNPDQDSLWDTSDENGNGQIDAGEIAGPVFDFAALGVLPSTTSRSFKSNTTPAQSQRTTSSWGVTTNLQAPEALLQGVRVPTSRVDDLNGGGASFVFIDLDDDGDFETGEPFGIDFDDLHTFNISFDRVIADPHTETHGMQMGSRHRFSAKQDAVDSAQQSLELSYGARYLRLTENYVFEGTGSILGRTTVDMTYDNRLVGPQVAMDWKRNHRGWNLSAGSTLMLGYNFAEAYQFGVVGMDLVPGGVNRSATLQPTIRSSKREHEELASIAELNARATYPLRRNMDFHVGYRALYISDLRHAGESIDFDLPSFGILDRDSNGAWMEGLHASIEWRR